MERMNALRIGMVLLQHHRRQDLTVGRDDRGTGVIARASVSRYAYLSIPRRMRGRAKEP